MDIKFVESQSLKSKPTDESKLGFGKIFTDYMFIMDYYDNGWHDARIVPYGPISLDPAGMVLHYAQETFEGMKAYRNAQGGIQLFRPYMNALRMIKSNQRLCMPEISEDDFVAAVIALVQKEQDWVPHSIGTSLYIRPFMYATQAGVGVHAANAYSFVIICSPVGSYYPNGLAPVKIYVEDEYVRAVKGGTGFAKCGGNYASSIIAQSKAEKMGYTQVLWLDGCEHKYVEEVGTMNVFFKINNVFYTAPLNGSVLGGITRDSVITLLRKQGHTVIEAPLAIEDIMVAANNKTLQEAFGSGTAALISPIGELKYQDQVVTINNFEIGESTAWLYDSLVKIQWGATDEFSEWQYKL